MCRVLGVSPSGFYAWRQRPPSARSRADAQISLRMSAIHQRSHATYGAPQCARQSGLPTHCRELSFSQTYGDLERVEYKLRTGRIVHHRPRAPELLLLNRSASRA